MPFDPGEHVPDADGGSSKFLQTSGRFVVVFTALRSRGTTQAAKKPYVRFRTEVVAGHPPGNEGKAFSQRVFINEEAHGRLGAMCHAMGMKERFELEDDRAVRAAMCGRPFVAKVKVTSGNDGDTYAGIAFSEQNISQEERDAVNAWIERATAAGFYEKLHEQQSWDHGNQGREEGDPGPGDDDNIPF